MSTYYAFIDNKVTGPFGLEQLKNMRLPDNVAIRAETDNDWSTWSEVNPEPKPVPQVEVIAATSVPANAPNPTAILSKLRNGSAYPELRVCFFLFGVFDVMAAFCFGIAIVGDPAHATIYATAMAASLVALVPLSMSGVVLDIADAQIKRLSMTLCLLAFSTLMLQASIPVGIDEVTQHYGAPDEQKSNGGRPVPGGTSGLTFHSDEVTIHVISAGSTVIEVDFARDSAFAELEIGLLLKPLSTGEKWVEGKDGRTWTLPKAQVTATWDGEGKVVVK